MAITIKRVYDPASPDDGARILVDRLWPRGMTKEHAALTVWMKDVSPSTALRTWFGHMTDRFDEFTAAYRKELDTEPEAQKGVAELIDMARKGNVTLLYAAKDPNVNHTHVLKAYLEEKMAQP